MEYKNREIIKQYFRVDCKTIVVLDIDDIYPFNDPELVGILHVSLAEYL